MERGEAKKASKKANKANKDTVKCDFSKPKEDIGNKRNKKELKGPLEQTESSKEEAKAPKKLAEVKAKKEVQVQKVVPAKAKAPITEEKKAKSEPPTKKVMQTSKSKSKSKLIPSARKPFDMKARVQEVKTVKAGKSISEAKEEVKIKAIERSEKASRLPVPVQKESVSQKIGKSKQPRIVQPGPEKGSKEVSKDKQPSTSSQGDSDVNREHDDLSKKLQTFLKGKSGSKLDLISELLQQLTTDEHEVEEVKALEQLKDEPEELSSSSLESDQGMEESPESDSESSSKRSHSSDSSYSNAEEKIPSEKGSEHEKDPDEGKSSETDFSADSNDEHDNDQTEEREEKHVESEENLARSDLDEKWSEESVNQSSKEDDDKSMKDFEMDEENMELEADELGSRDLPMEESDQEIQSLEGEHINEENTSSFNDTETKHENGQDESKQESTQEMKEEQDSIFNKEKELSGIFDEEGGSTKCKSPDIKEVLIENPQEALKSQESSEEGLTFESTEGKDENDNVMQAEALAEDVEKTPAQSLNSVEIETEAERSREEESLECKDDTSNKNEEFQEDQKKDIIYQVDASLGVEKEEEATKDDQTKTENAGELEPSPQIADDTKPESGTREKDVIDEGSTMNYEGNDDPIWQSKAVEDNKTSEENKEKGAVGEESLRHDNLLNIKSLSDAANDLIIKADDTEDRLFESEDTTLEKQRSKEPYEKALTLEKVQAVNMNEEGSSKLDSVDKGLEPEETLLEVEPAQDTCNLTELEDTLQEVKQTPVDHESRTSEKGLEKVQEVKENNYLSKDSERENKDFDEQQIKDDETTKIQDDENSIATDNTLKGNDANSKECLKIENEPEIPKSDIKPDKDTHDHDLPEELLKSMKTDDRTKLAVESINLQETQKDKANENLTPQDLESFQRIINIMEKVASSAFMKQQSFMPNPPQTMINLIEDYSRYKSCPELTSVTVKKYCSDQKATTLLGKDEITSSRENVANDSSSTKEIQEEVHAALQSIGEIKASMSKMIELLAEQKSHDQSSEDFQHESDNSLDEVTVSNAMAQKRARRLERKGALVRELSKVYEQLAGAESQHSKFRSKSLKDRKHHPRLIQEYLFCARGEEEDDDDDDDQSLLLPELQERHAYELEAIKSLFEKCSAGEAEMKKVSQSTAIKKSKLDLAGSSKIQSSLLKNKENPSREEQPRLWAPSKTDNGNNAKFVQPGNISCSLCKSKTSKLFKHNENASKCFKFQKPAVTVNHLSKETSDMKWSKEGSVREKICAFEGDTPDWSRSRRQIDENDSHESCSDYSEEIMNIIDGKETEQSYGITNKRNEVEKISDLETDQSDHLSKATDETFIFYDQTADQDSGTNNQNEGFLRANEEPSHTYCLGNQLLDRKKKSESGEPDNDHDEVDDEKGRVSPKADDEDFKSREGTEAEEATSCKSPSYIHDTHSMTSSYCQVRPVQVSISMDDLLNSNTLTINFTGDKVNISSSKEILTKSCIDIAAKHDGGGKVSVRPLISDDKTKRTYVSSGNIINLSDDFNGNDNFLSELSNSQSSVDQSGQEALMENETGSDSSSHEIRSLEKQSKDLTVLDAMREENSSDTESSNDNNNQAWFRDDASLETVLNESKVDQECQTEEFDFSDAFEALPPPIMFLNEGNDQFQDKEEDSRLDEVATGNRFSLPLSSSGSHEHLLDDIQETTAEDDIDMGSTIDSELEQELGILDENETPSNKSLQSLIIDDSSLDHETYNESQENKMNPIIHDQSNAITDLKPYKPNPLILPARKEVQWRDPGALMTTKLCKILFIGSSSTGKTSLIRRYVKNTFAPIYRATIGADFLAKLIHWDERTILRLQLWDIAGQDRFSLLSRSFYKDAVGAFIVCDLSRPDTLDTVGRWKDELDHKVHDDQGNPVPCYLLGNKCDLLDASSEQVHQYNKICRQHNFSGWMHTSAKEDINVTAAVETLLTKIIEEKPSLYDDSESTKEFETDSGVIKRFVGESEDSIVIGAEKRNKKSCPC